MYHHCQWLQFNDLSLCLGSLELYAKSLPVDPHCTNDKYLRMFRAVFQKNLLTYCKIMYAAHYFSEWHNSESTKSVHLCFSLTSGGLEADVLGPSAISIWRKRRTGKEKTRKDKRRENVTSIKLWGVFCSVFSSRTGQRANSAETVEGLIDWRNQSK